MKVLVTGATGYVGTAVARALRDAGHAVYGLARSAAAMVALEDRGDHVVQGDLQAAADIVRAARAADGVIHLAMARDADPWEADATATAAILHGLHGTGKPFIYTGGAWDYGDTGEGPHDEDSPLHPLPFLAWRSETAQLVRSAAPAVRSIVIRPGAVYGHGGGLPAMWTTTARQSGAARFVGTGQQHWSMVHVDDLADLYVRALEHAPAGEVFLGVTGEPLQVRTLAEAASRGAGAGGRTEAWPVEAACRELGAWAAALVLDQHLSGEKAQKRLGWTPHAPSALEDLEHGSYAAM